MKCQRKALVVAVSLIQICVCVCVGGVAAGRSEGDPVLSEGEAADHRSGGEHERLRLSQMQGDWCPCRPGWTCIVSVSLKSRAEKLENCLI